MSPVLYFSASRLLILCLFLLLGLLPIAVLGQDVRGNIGRDADEPPPGLNIFTITGRVIDEAREPMPGAVVQVVGKVQGTITDFDGNYTITLSTPEREVYLRFSYIGYTSQEIKVRPISYVLNVTLKPLDIQANTVVVSASRVLERIAQAPVSIERVDALTVRQTPGGNYYQALSSLKGLDITTSSITFQVLNARGFNNTGNNRFLQLFDGMDTQAPVLNFPISNLNGPSELDLEGVEFIPGASSALYGPAAFNGALIMTSKDPFRFQGASAYVKVGTHVPRLGGPTLPLYDASVRYAKALFNDRLAFKLNFSYFASQDWNGLTLDDLNAGLRNGLAQNPAYNGVHTLGDETAINLRLLLEDPTYRTTAVAQLNALTSNQFGMLAMGLGISEEALLRRMTPNQAVARTGYIESAVVDYNARNIKGNAALHYRVNDALELSYQFNGGFGNSIYTGAQRYSVIDFGIRQHRLEARGDNFFVRAYVSIETSGSSYIGEAVATAVGNAYSDTRTQWLPTYSIAYAANLLQQLGGSAGGVFSNPNPAVPLGVMNNAHLFGRQQADAGRLQPGTEAFNTAFNAAKQTTIPDGGRFDDNSRMWHAETQYNFKNQIEPKTVELIAGGSFRVFDMRTNGTLLDDAPGQSINFWELGVYAQGTKKFFNDRLKAVLSVRYDKNQYFSGQTNPRLALVYSAGDHHFRGSVQTGFRFPTTQGMFINLDVITQRLLGGLPSLIFDRYRLNEQTYTERSVQTAAATLASGGSIQQATALLQDARLQSVGPENVRSYEVGYRGTYAGGRLYVDFSYYLSAFTNFIGQLQVRRAPAALNLTAPGIAEQNFILAPAISNSTAAGPNEDPLLPSVMFAYTNSPDRVLAHGVVFGVDYSLPKNYYIGTNFNYNQVIERGDPLGIVDPFNTPRFKVNVTAGCRELLEVLSWGVSLRWQDAFFWQSSFANGPVPAVTYLDAQVSCKVPAMRSIIKLGASNLFNTRYFTNYGSPEIGAIYYLQLTFDEFLR